MPFLIDIVITGFVETNNSNKLNLFSRNANILILYDKLLIYSLRRTWKLEIHNGRSSFFDGSLLSLIGWSILGAVITLITFGICYPWALCMVYGWKINHTVIEGKRMIFNGSAFNLFSHWIKWFLLTIITIGIYSFWVTIKLEDWKARNTTFVN